MNYDLISLLKIDCGVVLPFKKSAPPPAPRSPRPPVQLPLRPAAIGDLQKLVSNTLAKHDRQHADLDRRLTALELSNQPTTRFH